MIEEDTKTEAQRKVREEEERKEKKILEAAIQKSHLFLIKQLSEMSTQVSILGLLLMPEQHKERFLGIFRKSFMEASIMPNMLENKVARV